MMFLYFFLDIFVENDYTLYSLIGLFSFSKLQNISRKYFSNMQSNLPFGVTTAIRRRTMMSNSKTKSMMYMSVKRTSVSLFRLSSSALLADDGQNIHTKAKTNKHVNSIHKSVSNSRLQELLNQYYNVFSLNIFCVVNQKKQDSTTFKSL